MLLQLLVKKPAMARRGMALIRSGRSSPQEDLNQRVSIAAATANPDQQLLYWNLSLRNLRLSLSNDRNSHVCRGDDCLDRLRDGDARRASRE